MRRSEGERGPTGVRVVLALLAVTALQVGVWAAASPRSFYDDFPQGRAWVAADGPYNEHLVRDVGNLNLALLVLTVFALLRFGPVIVRATAGAWLAYAVPHFAYHLRHTDLYDGFDLVANLVSLALMVVGPLLLLWMLRRLPSSSGVAPSATTSG